MKISVIYSRNYPIWSGDVYQTLKRFSFVFREPTYSLILKNGVNVNEKDSLLNTDTWRIKNYLNGIISCQMRCS